MERLFIDKFGRVVIPKSVRVRHGWRPGTALVLQDDGMAVRLESAPTVVERPGLIIRDGRMVFDAEWLAAPGVDAVRDAIELSRDECSDRIAK